MVSFRDRVTRIAALAEPMRRELYLYVCAQPEAVGRDEAAAAVDIPVHKAKFHLDRLEHEGLLSTEYARLSGRTGPGAGRTSKLYRRADVETAVSLPDRDYALAGRIMAEAIALSAQTGEPAASTLTKVAGDHGRDLGVTAAEELPDAHDRDSALENARSTLAGYGYEPRRIDDQLTLVNCPFHALAQEQTELVCEMNLALVSGVTETLYSGRLACELDPMSGRCCVVVRAQ